MNTVQFGAVHGPLPNPSQKLRDCENKGLLVKQHYVRSESHWQDRSVKPGYYVVTGKDVKTLDKINASRTGAQALADATRKACDTLQSTLYSAYFKNLPSTGYGQDPIAPTMKKHFQAISKEGFDAAQSLNEQAKKLEAELTKKAKA